jgi:hypothetical protein
MVSGESCSVFLAVAKFVKEVDNLLDNFSGVLHIDPGKTLCCPVSDDSTGTI